MMAVERPRGYVRITQNQAETLERWVLPEYDAFESKNALNYQGESKDSESLISSLTTLPEIEKTDSNEESLEALSPLTASDLDAIRQSAYEEGLQQGLKDGREKGQKEGYDLGLELGKVEGHQQGLVQGITKGQADIDQQVMHWVTLAEKLTLPIAESEAELVSQIQRLVLELTRILIQVEIESNPHVLLQTITAALHALPTTNRTVTLCLHPNDIETLNRILDDADLSQKKWQLETDISCQQGDVQVMCGDAHISFVISDRVNHLFSEFQKKQITSNFIS